MYNKFIRLKFISSLIRRFSSRYMFCEVCGLPWSHCTPKYITLRQHMMIVICDHCWKITPFDTIKNVFIKYFNSKHHKKLMDFLFLAKGQKYDEDYLIEKVTEEYNKKIISDRYFKMKKILKKI